MTPVFQIRPRQLQKLAVTFVNLYEKKTPREAAVWIKGKYRKDETKQMKELINKEFLAQGYTFNG